MKRRQLLAGLMGVGLMLSGGAPALGRQVPGSSVRQLRMPLTVRNPLGEKLEGQVLNLCAPLDHTGVQRVTSLVVDVPHELLTDDIGNRIVRIAFPPLLPYATRVVTLSATVELQRVAGRERLGGDEATWLGGEAFIEVEDAAIRTLASELRGADARATASAIHDWLRANVAYAGFDADDLGALHALRTRKADCTEYAYLAVALARANGVPARVIGGYVASSDFVPYADNYHNWAEVYVDGAWRLLDAQRGLFDAGYEDYVAFRRNSARVENALRGAHRFRVDGSIRVSLPR